MNSLYVELSGWIGVTFILWAYTALIYKKFRITSRRYLVLNCFGGSLLAANCFFNRSLPSMATNMIWAGLAVYAFSRIKKNRRDLKRLLRLKKHKKRKRLYNF